jgi:hypothetical protein
MKKKDIILHGGVIAGILSLMIIFLFMPAKGESVVCTMWLSEHEGKLYNLSEIQNILKDDFIMVDNGSFIPKDNTHLEISLSEVNWYCEATANDQNVYSVLVNGDSLNHLEQDIVQYYNIISSKLYFHSADIDMESWSNSRIDLYFLGFWGSITLLVIYPCSVIAYRELINDAVKIKVGNNMELLHIAGNKRFIPLIFGFITLLLFILGFIISMVKYYELGGFLCMVSLFLSIGSIIISFVYGFKYCFDTNFYVGLILGCMPILIMILLSILVDILSANMYRDDYISLLR